MTTTVDGPTTRADRIGRGLLALCAVATLVPFVGGFQVMADSADDDLMTNAWRTFAYVVFAGLWAMLAFSPRGYRGVWELLFAHKIGITVYALAFIDMPDARMTFFVDLSLVVATGLAYVLCRGWYTWRTPA